MPEPIGSSDGNKQQCTNNEKDNATTTVINPSPNAIKLHPCRFYILRVGVWHVDHGCWLSLWALLLAARLQGGLTLTNNNDMKTITITMNESGLPNEVVVKLADRAFGEHDQGVWRLFVADHTDHADRTFPCINAMAADIPDYNVIIDVKAS